MSNGRAGLKDVRPRCGPGSGLKAAAGVCRVSRVRSTQPTELQGWGEAGQGLASLPLESKAVRVEMPKGLRGLF